VKYFSDRDELIALIAQSTGQDADAHLVSKITEMLELRLVPLREYLDDIRPRLGRLSERAGPGFFYTHARTFPSATAKVHPSLSA